MFNTIIYEDQLVDSLLPFSPFRAAFELRTGFGTLLDKILAHFDYGNVTLWVREAIGPVTRARYPKRSVNIPSLGAPALFLNARCVMTANLAKRIIEMDHAHPFMFTAGGDVVALYLSTDLAKTFFALLEKGPVQSDALISQFRTHVIAAELDEARLITSIPDLIALNTEMIRHDFEQTKQGGIIKGDLAPNVAILNEPNVFIASQVVIEDFVVLNAKSGPIYIDEDAFIESHSRLEGPLYVGKGARILGGKVSASSIGAHAKAAGEMTHTILSPTANKGHAGFVGHSYIGEWVNLGAGTTTSNLKNTYGPVNIDFGNGKVPTGHQFLGAIIGDHAKLGIGTHLATGSVVGLGANIWGTALHSNFIPAFSWGEPKAYQCIELSKMLQIADRMMARRDGSLLEAERALLTTLHSPKNPA